MSKKTKPTTSSRRHQTATKRSTFWQSDLRDNCDSGYHYVFHLTCVMSIPAKNVSYKLHFGGK